MNDSIKFLTQIHEKKFTHLQPEQLDALLVFMLEHIGHTDSYIRDTLIYSGFCELILNNHLTDSQLILIAKTCSDDERLYFNINELQSDAVLTRSFSALAIQLVLYKDQNERFLTEQLAAHIITKSIDYLKFEHDYRGYIDNKGWAHSVAHGSDLLARAVSHPLFSNVATTAEVLTIVEKCLCTDYAYIDEEDERMMPVIDALLEKGLSEADLHTWLEKLSQFQHDEYLKHYRVHWNIKKFMLSLYVHFIRKQQYIGITNWIFKTYIDHPKNEE
ncbi:DUF2785 domain-containing protein [Solibacillus daqui]|uniref:DUF2785 domain-containing protein n=1 Tax=Solibacillus daqui TaxID=2912187 RepID=UPI0023671775|nr:DUF2785 domain-containing protein [Solibacillus daqui]